MKKALITVMGLLALTSQTEAQECSNNTPFAGWLTQFKQHAISQGISAPTLNTALTGITYDPSVIKRDRQQHQFAQDFRTFAHKLISPYRLKMGQKLMQQHSKLFHDIQNRYGVPAYVLVAFWGLETDFGKNMGNESTLRSLATLAYDCRRGNKFGPELLAALRLIEQGDLTVAQMRGAWAGEMGQTQFLPSYYLRYAVDFDRDGKRNLIQSTADALASTANYLQQLGWQNGQLWMEEVILPPNFPWEQSGLEQSYPLAHWSQLGVVSANGRPLQGSASTSLLLPMGKDGPAFLAYDNFKNAYLTWNESLLYSMTAAYFATRLAGVKPMRANRANINALSFAQIKQLQQILTQRGYDVGRIDGIIGEKTRLSVKRVQQQLGMPMDAYPTVELLQKLQK